MAEEEQDSAEKNQEPTERRKQKAHEKGQTAQSRELYHVAILGGFLLFCGVWGAEFLQKIYYSLACWFTKVARRKVGVVTLLRSGVFSII